jgi:acyl-CoA thioester hydrolase
VEVISSSVFKTSFRVTWVDTDAAQVVHYTNYFRYFERVEEEFYRELGFTFDDIATKGLWLPRVEAFCQYMKPARFNDLLKVELNVRELKEESFKLYFRVFNEGTGLLLANGYVVIVCASRNTGKATRIPEGILRKLKPFCK